MFFFSKSQVHKRLMDLKKEIIKQGGESGMSGSSKLKLSFYVIRNIFFKSRRTKLVKR